MQQTLTNFKSFEIIIGRVLFFIFMILISGCTEDPVGVKDDDIIDEKKRDIELKLTADEVATKKMWIKVEISDSLLKGETLILTSSKDNKIVSTKEFKLNRKDTTFYFGGLNFDRLKPNAEYSYKIYLKDSVLIDSSEVLNVRTLDVNRITVTWDEPIYLGASRHGEKLNDVEIISENDIWVVGWFSLDSTIENEKNIYHYDGVKWESYCIKTRYYPSSTEKVMSQIRDIIYFENDGLYITTSTNLLKYNLLSKSWDEIFIVPQAYAGYINEIWGTSGKNIYIASGYGDVLHYNGSVISYMKTGNDIPLYDIYGSPDGSKVWACGHAFYPERSILLEYSLNENGLKEWKPIWKSSESFLPLLTQIRDIYSTKHRVFFVGHNIVLTKKDNEKKLYADDYAVGGLGHLKGYAENDIYASGSGGLILHFNGETWEELHRSFPQRDDIIYSLSVKGNTIVATGSNYDNFFARPFILKGKINK